jgi:hypothetical protein
VLEKSFYIPKKIKLITFIVLGIFIALFLIYHSFFYIDSKIEISKINTNISIERLNADELAQLQNGDIISRRGFGFFSDFIASNLNKNQYEITHSGILVKEKNDWFVIHSLSSDVSDIDGVQKQDLKTFLEASEPNKIIVSRIKNTSASTRNLICIHAQKYLDKGILFDHKGDYDNAEELFCTELIWHILEQDLDLIQTPTSLESRKEFFYSMSPLYDTVRFELIKNDFRD